MTLLRMRWFYYTAVFTIIYIRVQCPIVMKITDEPDVDAWFYGKLNTFSIIRLSAIQWRTLNHIFIQCAWLLFASQQQKYKNEKLPTDSPNCIPKYSPSISIKLWKKKPEKRHSIAIQTKVESWLNHSASSQLESMIYLFIQTGVFKVCPPKTSSAIILYR